MATEAQSVKRIALAATGLGWFLFSVDLTVITVALPTIGADFDAPLTSLQWVVTAYVVTVAALLLPAGRLGDHWGADRVFMAGLAVFGLASVVSALAPTLWVLVIGRAAQGVGGAAMTATGLALLSLSYGDDVAGRTRAIGWWAALGGVGGAVGVMLGGVVVSAVGWRPLFWLNIPIVALALWLTSRLPRRARDGEAAPLDVGQLVAGAIAIALLVACLALASSANTLVVVALAAGALIALAAFAWRQRISAHPTIPPSILRVPRARRALLLGLVMNAQFYVSLLAFTIYFQLGLGWTAAVTGLAFLPAILPTPIAMPAAARLSAVKPPRLVLAALVLISLVGFLIMALSSIGTPYVLLALAMICVAVSMSGVVVSPLTRMLMDGVSLADAGAALGVLTMMRQVGASVGAASIAIVVAGDPADAVSRAGWSCVVLVVVCGLLLAPGRRSRAESMPSA